MTDPPRAAVAAGILPDEAQHRALLQSIVEAARAIFSAGATTSRAIAERYVAAGAVVTPHKAGEPPLAGYSTAPVPPPLPPQFTRTLGRGRLPKIDDRFALQHPGGQEVSVFHRPAPPP